MMYCHQCGKQLPEGTKFCQFCGATQQPGLVPATPVNLNPGFAVAGRGRRFLNLFIDGLLIWVVDIALLFVLDAINPKFPFSIYYLFTLALPIVYYLLFEGLWQRSIGKFATGTKVVMRDGSQPDFKHILGRSFARWIPFEVLSFVVSPIGWHDSLSKTLVVPNTYGPAEVQQIDPNAKTKGANWIIVIIVAVVLLMVIGFMSSVVLLALNSARGKARDAKRTADTRLIASALELYRNDHPGYPPTLDALLQGHYMVTLPTAPTPPDGTCTPDENQYSYQFRSQDDYILRFCLGQAAGGMNAGDNALTPQGILPNVPFDNAR